MKKLLITSDIHMDERRLREIIESDADTIIVGGDILNYGSQEEYKYVLKVLGKAKCNDIIWVLGNHDVFPSFLVDDFDTLTLDGKIMIGKIFELERYGKKFFFTGYTPYLSDRWCNQYQGIERELKVMMPKEEVDYIISHCPPSHFDCSRLKNHKYHIDIGSKALADYIENSNVKRLFYGHLHACDALYSQPFEIQGRYYGCKCHNVSEKSVIIEMENEERDEMERKYF